MLQQRASIRTSIRGSCTGIPAGHLSAARPLSTAPPLAATNAGSRQCKLCPSGTVSGSGGTGPDAWGASACTPCPQRTFRPSMYAANTCTLCE